MTPHVRDHLSAFLDSELPPTQRHEVTIHLEACRECQQVLDELRRLDDLARGLAAPLPADSHVWPARVRARLAASRRVPSRVWWAVAALLVLTVLPWQLLRNRDLAPAPEPPTAREAEPQAAAPAARGDRAPGRPTTSASNKSLAREAPPSTSTRSQPAPPGGGTRRPAEDFVSPPAPAGGATAYKYKERRAPEDERAKAGPARDLPDSSVTRSAPEASSSSQAAAAGTAPPRAGGGSTDDEAVFAELSASPIRTSDEARARRDQWTAFRRRFPGSSRGERAELLGLEAAAAAYDQDRREDDLRKLKALGEEYLKRPKGPSPEGREEVERLLREAGTPGGLP